MALTKMIDFLELNVGMRREIIKAHDRRSETTYRSAIPPVSNAEARTMCEVQATVLPLAQALLYEEYSTGPNPNA